MPSQQILARSRSSGFAYKRPAVLNSQMKSLWRGVESCRLHRPVPLFEQYPQCFEMRRAGARSLVVPQGLPDRIAEILTTKLARLGVEPPFNSLMTFGQIPDFKSLTSAEWVPALTYLVNRNTQKLNEMQAGTSKPTYQNFLKPFLRLEDELEQAWSSIRHLSSVTRLSHVENRRFGECIRLMENYDGDSDKMLILCSTLKQIQSDSQFQSLKKSEQRTVELTLQGLKFRGADLCLGDRQKLNELYSDLTQLSMEFSNNIVQATGGWTKHTYDRADLSGLPEYAISALQRSAERSGRRGYLLTLDPNTVQIILAYADDRKLREEVYRANAQKCGPNSQFDNTQIVRKILSNRLEIATILGFDNYAEMQLSENRMADSPQEVVNFLTRLGDLTQETALQGRQELRQYALENFGVEELKPSDTMYYSQKMLANRSSVSLEKLSEYFSERSVVDGLFHVISRLYNVRFEEDRAVKGCQKNVNFYRLYDETSEEEIGGLFMDLYARPGKRDGAWMDISRNHVETSKGDIQKPVAHLVCNFQQSQFSMREVTILFHEAGHCLHHLLTQVSEPGVNGINGVPWDVVELPSQYMENWARQPETIPFLTRHRETQASLPKAMLAEVLKELKRSKPAEMMAQLEIGLLDIAMHSVPVDESFDPVALELNIRQQLGLESHPMMGSRVPVLSHLFGGSYAVGYYGYKWAEVMAYDIFSLFETSSVFDQPTALRFKDTFLAAGGSESPKDLYLKLMGREQSDRALLKAYGLSDDV